jgi:hypothetical protein
VSEALDSAGRQVPEDHEPAVERREDQYDVVAVAGSTSAENSLSFFSRFSHLIVVRRSIGGNSRAETLPEENNSILIDS